MDLILASASPRRAELLRSAGFDFEVVVPEVDETLHPSEEARSYALRVARAKAHAVPDHLRESGTAILAADTVVVTGDRILGKPRDRANAESMLRMLAGSTHEVHTAVVVLCSDRELSDIATTRVHFLPMTDREIDWYLSTGEPEGKAGAYAIQGRGARFVDRIEGSWSNVVGLPVASVYRMLSTTGRR